MLPQNIETISSFYSFSYQTDSITENRRKDIDCNTELDIIYQSSLNKMNNL